MVRGPRSGRGAARPPFMGPSRLMRPGFDPPFGRPRPMMRGHPPRPGIPHIPRPGLGLPLIPRPGMAPRLLPPRPPHPPRHLHPSDIPPPPIHFPGRHPRMPPRPMLPVPPFNRPGIPLLRPTPPVPPLSLIRGRGGGLKRLGFPAFGRARPMMKAKKPLNDQKRREKKEGEFFCETCDRAWKTQEKLDAHIAEHEVCGRDGCTFTAHPKMILQHVKFQHDSGLFEKIVVNDKNPEDVAKWIAERKSRFPSRENVEKKKAQEKEMFDRGERIPSQGKRFQNRDNFINQRNKRMRDNDGHEQRPWQKKPKPERTKINNEDKWRDPEAWNGNLPRFPGTAAFHITFDGTTNNGVKDEIEVSDDEDSFTQVKAVNNDTEKPIISSVLASLVTNYGSDLSDEEESGLSNALINDFHQGTNHSLHDTEEPQLSRIKIKKEDADSGPEESGIEREDKSGLPLLPLNVQRNSESKRNSKSNESNSEVSNNCQRVQRPAPARTKYMQKHQLTLLEKLLKSEIRHERNVILQCVRYVVRNHFFN